MEHIKSEHPDHKAWKATWSRYHDLYVGGEQLKRRAELYLTRRQKEPLDVYQERLQHVYYENFIGSIIDWYAATLFRREPVIQIEGHDELGRRFLNAFAEDCDLRGTNLTDYFRDQFVKTLIFGASYTLVDFPKVSTRYENRAEEEMSGKARAYLVSYSPENVVNWSYDSQGNFEWVVLKQTVLRKDSVENLSWKRETQWSYYDKTHYRIYREIKNGDANAVTELVDEGLHGFANHERVPLFEWRVSEGLWLMNKAGLIQLEHFNKSNALGWALTMGLFATPVVYSEREWNQIVGESYYIQLGPQDRFGWAEPEGKVYQIASDNLRRLQEEVYRVCYLMNQAGGSSASATAQSGLSKLRDFAITQEVLRAFGDSVKDVLKRVLRAVVEARQDALSVDVSGMDEFDIGDFDNELTQAERLLAVGIDSPTLKKHILKRLAQKYLCDVRQEAKDQISREIDASFERA